MREAAQALGDLGAAVQAQQNASERFHERLHGVEETHARRTETVEGELAGIKRAIKALDHKVAEATSSLVCRPATLLSTVGDRSLSPKGPAAWAATSGADAARPVGPVRKKVTHFEGLRTPGVTESCYAPKGTPFGKLPLDVGAVGWHEESVNWSEYLNRQIPLTTYLGTIVQTVPSTTVQSTMPTLEVLGISSGISAPVLLPEFSPAAA